MPPKRPAGGIPAESNADRKRQRHEETMEEEEGGSDDAMVEEEFVNYESDPSTGAEAEAGIIEQVTLKNFMCHSFLDVKFKPHINFITGNNSSGKSATLTAIIVGLGGKANNTDRGTALKGFIKNGCSTAVVTVKLRNRGTDAFKPALYGPSIVVERRLTKEGPTFYKIKSANGKTISTKREELNGIIDAFNIQVDNPVCILNQTTSRNFLHSTNASDKYKPLLEGQAHNAVVGCAKGGSDGDRIYEFFLKGTQLEQLKHDYLVANEYKEKALNVLHEKQEVLPVLEEEVESLLQQYKASSAFKGLDEKVERLKDEWAWSTVIKVEQEVEDSLRELQTEEARLPRYTAAVDKHEHELAECEKERAGLHTKIQDRVAEGLELEPRHREARRDVQQAKADLRTVQMDERKTLNEHKALTKEHTALLDRIEEIKNAAQRDYEAERAERDRRVLELEEMTLNLHLEQHTLEEELEQYVDAVRSCKEDKDTLSQEEAQVSKQRGECQKELTRLDKARKDRMVCYGEWVPKALAGIEAHHRRGLFHKKPLGPLGSYVELKDLRWAVGVEACLSWMLRAFYVHDHHDETQLELVLKKCCPKAKVTIITSAFQDRLFNVAENRAHGKYPAVIDVITVKVPAVMNCLIDQRNIENVVLIADPEEARRVMLRSPPPKVWEAYTPIGDHVYPAPMFRYYSVSKDQRYTRVLGSSVQVNIKETEEKLAGCERRKQQLYVRQAEVTAKVTQNQLKVNECKTRLNHLREQISDLDMELRELREQEDPAPVDISALEEDTRQIEVKLKVVEERKVAAQGQVSQQKAQLTVKEGEFAVIEARLHEIAHGTEPYEEQRARLDNRITEVKGHVSHYRQKKTQHEAKVASLRRNHGTLNAQVQEDIAKANKICGRIKTRRSVASIEAEILQIQQQITRHQQLKGNHRAIAEKYHGRKTALQKIQHEVAMLENYLQALGSVMKVRQQQYATLRTLTAIQVRMFFQMMLCQRDYDGNISFNHAKEQLSMQAVPKTHKGAGSKDLRSLSGGERSYTTVCFIVSLWDAMEAPFRCLDEYDIYMKRHVGPDRGRV